MIQDKSTRAAYSIAAHLKGVPERSSSCQVNVTLVAQPTASGTYNVQLTSNGDTGASAFVAYHQNPAGSSAQSNTWPVYVGPVSVSVLGRNLTFLYGTSSEDPATSNNIVIAQGAPTGGTYTWSGTPNATLTGVASGNPSIATLQYASQSTMVKRHHSHSELRLQRNEGYRDATRYCNEIFLADPGARD